MGSVENPVDQGIADALRKYGVDVDVSGFSADAVVSTLTSIYPKNVITAAEISTWRAEFWSSNQQAAQPLLIFQPTSAQQVAVALLLARAASLTFAVKSGGHAAMKGASSVDDGLVIDLKNLNAVELVEEKTIARIGAGNKWKAVFEELAKDGLAVAGGRSAGVGVGGYTLGGGLSFFASTRGWGCDNVRNFELVTASGDILDVNYQSYPDLFWALRGGGSNFGIVTRFDYETFPQGDLYGGSVLFSDDNRNAVLSAFTEFASNADPKSATWLCAAHHEGKKLINVLALHTDPTDEFKLLKDYSAIPSLHNGHKIRSLANMVEEIDVVQARDHRECYWTHTFKVDADFISWLVEYFFNEFGKHSGTYETKLETVLLLQPYSKKAISFMKRDGGNCLPLNEEEAPYLNVMFPTAWKHEKDDELVLGSLRSMFDDMVAEGKRRGLYVDYMYMNYAAIYQDVLKGYGKENYAKMKQVAAKYDPDAVFQKLTPGYFKLDRVAS